MAVPGKKPPPERKKNPGSWRRMRGARMEWDWDQALWHLRGTGSAAALLEEGAARVLQGETHELEAWTEEEIVPGPPKVSIGGQVFTMLLPSAMSLAAGRRGSLLFCLPPLPADVADLHFLEEEEGVDEPRAIVPARDQRADCALARCGARLQSAAQGDGVASGWESFCQSLQTDPLGDLQAPLTLEELLDISLQSRELLRGEAAQARHLALHIMSTQLHKALELAAHDSPAADPPLPLLEAARKVVDCLLDMMSAHVFEAAEFDALLSIVDLPGRLGDAATRNARAWYLVNASPLHRESINGSDR